MNGTTAPATAQFPPSGSDSLADLPPTEGRRPVPLVHATPTKAGGQLTFYCAGCRSNHLYGRPEPGSDMTRFRASHCFDPSSPTYERTVYLVEVGPGDPRLTKPPRGRRPIGR